VPRHAACAGLSMSTSAPARQPWRRRASPRLAAAHASAARGQCCAACLRERAARSRAALRPRRTASSASTDSAATRSPLASARSCPLSSRPKSCYAHDLVHHPRPVGNRRRLRRRRLSSPLLCAAEECPARLLSRRRAKHHSSPDHTEVERGPLRKQCIAHRGRAATPASGAASHATAVVSRPHAARRESGCGVHTTAPAQATRPAAKGLMDAAASGCQPHRAAATGSTAAPAG